MKGLIQMLVVLLISGSFAVLPGCDNLFGGNDENGVAEVTPEVLMIFGGFYGDVVVPVLQYGKSGHEDDGWGETMTVTTPGPVFPSPGVVKIALSGDTFLPGYGYAVTLTGFTPPSPDPEGGGWTIDGTLSIIPHDDYRLELDGELTVTGDGAPLGSARFAMNLYWTDGWGDGWSAITEDDVPDSADGTFTVDGTTYRVSEIVERRRQALD